MAANRANGGSQPKNQKDAGNYDKEAHQTTKQYTDATPEKRAEVDRRVREQQERKKEHDEQAAKKKQPTSGN